jgi:quinoprotein glucose dehydrogenase
MRILKTTRVAGLLITVAAMHAQTRKGEVEWPYYGGDQGGSKYSALTGINTKNVSGMHQAWVWKTGETPL